MKSMNPAIRTPKYPLSYVRVSDLRGIAQLATQATTGVTRITEGVHRSVWDAIGLSGGREPGQTRGITGLVYRSIHAITALAGKSVDLALAGVQALFSSAEADQAETLQRVAVLAALNGVIGDRLAATGNPLATYMTLRYRDEALNWQARSPLPGASAKVLLLVHGLCMTDLKRYARHRGQVRDHGAVLAESLGYTPVYLDYNSGLHISQNGRELSIRLEQLLDHWPKPIDELSVLAHSMGGLVARSAVHYARQQGFRWPGRLKNIVFLGTPHHGAALEQAGNWADVMLSSTPYTRPFSVLGQVRSAGITDLRHGHMLDEDWQGHDRFHRQADVRQPLPLPEDVACYSIAATLAGQRSTLANRLLGDGLVALHSAQGQHEDPRYRLAFRPASQWTAYGMNHMELLHSPKVARRIVHWLTPQVSAV